jgi:hypothetical protein
MVQLILESDIPKELDASQVAEYKQGLETLTEEFKNQATDFEKAEQKISEVLKQAGQPGKKLPEPNLDNWNVIKEFKTEVFQKTYSATGFIFGMILLDMKKGRKEIDEIQYAWSRSWLILKQNNPALSQYHYDELTTQNQKEILTTWEPPNAP